MRYTNSARFMKRRAISRKRATSTASRSVTGRRWERSVKRRISLIASARFTRTSAKSGRRSIITRRRYRQAAPLKRAMRKPSRSRASANSPPKNDRTGLLPCHYPHFYTKRVSFILARGCRRQHKAWGGASAEPQEFGPKKHTSPRRRATAIHGGLWLRHSQT